MTTEAMVAQIVRHGTGDRSGIGDRRYAVGVRGSRMARTTLRADMGEIVEVVERQSARPGIVRFETNRVLSGMGHERYVAGQLIEGDRPVDELARRLFARGGIAAVHINSGIVTVDLAKGFTSDGLADLIRSLYTFYEPGAERGRAARRTARRSTASRRRRAADAVELPRATPAQSPSTAMTTGTLHTPLRIGGTTTVRNRLYRAPVLEGAGDGPDCAERYAKQFVPNAEAGVGLIIQGNSCLTEEGRTSPGMTRVHTRENMLRLAPMVDAVHAAGAAIWIQVGHGGLFAMEAWHEPHRSNRLGPLLAPSPPRPWLRPVFRRAPVHAMTTQEVRDLVARYGEVAAWAREAGYDGIQLASANAKLLDQFLSPFWNRRDDEYGGSARNRARMLEEIRRSVAERAGCGLHVHREGPDRRARAAAPAPHDVGRGHRARPLVRGVGLRLDHAGRGVGVPRHDALARRRADVDLAQQGHEGPHGEGGAEAVRAQGDRGRATSSARSARAFKPVWNRSRFVATKAAVDVPVLAVGGIRTRAEVDAILDAGEADLVGIGRPFYAEPDLPRHILGDGSHTVLCQNSNLCVPAQMLGMKGACYNPEVVKLRSARRAG